MLNQDKPREKLLEWHYKNGFRSEDSEDEMTIFKRTERQYYRTQRRDCNDKDVVLKSRNQLPFERLILDCLGGKRLLKELMGKNIAEQDTTELVVYDYQ